MKPLYLFLILFVLLIAYRVLRLIQKRRRLSTKSSPKHPLIEAVKIMHEMANENTTVEGKVPGGYGEFGYDKTNPIPVRGIMGAPAYLNMLRTEKGYGIEYSRIGQAVAANIDNPIDMYEISVNGEYYCKLFFCGYYNSMSDIAPIEFKLEKGEK